MGDYSLHCQGKTDCVNRPPNSAIRVGSSMCQASTQDLSSGPQSSQSTRYCSPSHDKVNIADTVADQVGWTTLNHLKRWALMYLFYPGNMEGSMHPHRLGQFQPYFHRINNFEMPADVRGAEMGVEVQCQLAETVSQLTQWKKM